MLGLKPRATVKTIKETLDRNEKYMKGIIEIIYKLFFDFYGIEVIHRDEEWIRGQMFLQDETFDYERVKLQDESGLNRCA